MSKTSYFQRVAAVLCVAVVLIAALTPVAASLPIAILVRLCFLIAIAVITLLPHVEEQIHPRQTVAAHVFSPRPPPIL
jgi:hypothetical protein